MQTNGNSGMSVMEAVESLLKRRLVVTHMTFAANLKSLPEESRPYLEFLDNSRIAGFSGCNRFSGGFRVDEIANTIEIGPLACTRMYCEGMMEIEDGFLSALQSARRIATKERGFLLLNADGVEVLEFDELR